MARTGRRDCRVGQRKKNHINVRVEKLQKSIRKEKKSGVPSSQCMASATVESQQLTPTAVEFLRKMREEHEQSKSVTT